MEFETKYNIGDTVYSIHSSEPIAMEIDKITIEYIYGKCEISYGVISSEEVKKYFFEENLTKEKPKPKPKTIYDLACEDEYFCLSSTGRISRLVYYGIHDQDNINQGNAFLTKEEAKKEAKRRKIHQQLKKLAGGYEFEPNGDNFYISYDYYLNDIDLGWTDIIKESGLVYFETEELAQNAIDEIGVGVLLRDYLGIDEE